MLGVGRSALDVCFSVDYTFSVSTVEEIRTAIPKLSVEEKLQTMEALWQSLSSKPDALSRQPGTKKNCATANAISNQGNRDSSTGKKPKRTSVVKLREDQSCRKRGTT
jgi:hypothetical protein